MEKVENQIKSDLPEKDRSVCFFCGEPLTSDDFKCARVEETKNFIAHVDCVTLAISRKYLKD